MNYLVVEGYKDAAELFAKETGIKAGQDLAMITQRMEIRSEIQHGRIMAAVDRINTLSSELLDSHPGLSFRLAQQQMIEMIRSGEMQEALDFAQEELAPRAETHTEFLRDLENTMTLLVLGEKAQQLPNLKDYSPSSLLNINRRVRLANEVNLALLALQSNEKESKLPLMLRTLHWGQEALAKSTSFPQIVDYPSAAFEPPISFGSSSSSSASSS